MFLDAFENLLETAMIISSTQQRKDAHSNLAFCSVMHLKIC